MCESCDVSSSSLHPSPLKNDVADTKQFGKKRRQSGMNILSKHAFPQPLTILYAQYVVNKRFLLRDEALYHTDKNAD